MAKKSAVVAVFGGSANIYSHFHSQSLTLIKTKGELSNSIMKAVTPRL